MSVEVTGKLSGDSRSVDWVLICGCDAVHCDNCSTALVSAIYSIPKCKSVGIRRDSGEWCRL